MILSDEVHLRSYGQVSNARVDETPRCNSLYDMAIFGPRHDWVCGCEKRFGEEAEGYICSVCGVRVGVASQLRRRRFGHIDLRSPMAHPLVSGATICALPVIPIAFRRDGGWLDLDQLYGSVVAANTEPLDSTANGERCSERLTHFVKALFCNEGLEEQEFGEGRALRSLTWHMRDAWERSDFFAYGVFLRGLCLTVKPMC